MSRERTHSVFNTLCYTLSASNQFKEFQANSQRVNAETKELMDWIRLDLSDCAPACGVDSAMLKQHC